MLLRTSPDTKFYQLLKKLSTTVYSLMLTNRKLRVLGKLRHLGTFSSVELINRHTNEQRWVKMLNIFHEESENSNMTYIKEYQKYETE